MSRMITPDELPRWVPGELTIDTAPLGWDGVRLRGYRYPALDVSIPPMQDCMIVVYKDGATPMNRRCSGSWLREQVNPGIVSLLTHAAPSHWRWSEDVEVTHLYLSPAALAKVAEEAYQRDVRGVELLDVLRAEDTVLAGIADALVREAGACGLGSRLLVDALRNQACLHILRRYATVGFRDELRSGALSRAQCGLIEQYVEANLDRNIPLDELAGVVQLSAFHFTRKFRVSFGCPPHAWVLRRRLAHAQRLLARKDVPLKVVAARCGFADQSHMTRLFRRLLGVTPAECRKAAG